jgi:hypothetical protein
MIEDGDLGEEMACEIETVDVYPVDEEEFDEPERVD